MFGEAFCSWNSFVGRKRSHNLIGMVAAVVPVIVNVFHIFHNSNMTLKLILGLTLTETHHSSRFPVLAIGMDCLVYTDNTNPWKLSRVTLDSLDQITK